MLCDTREQGTMCRLVSTQEWGDTSGKSRQGKKRTVTYVALLIAAVALSRNALSHR